MLSPPQAIRSLGPTVRDGAIVYDDIARVSRSARGLDRSPGGRAAIVWSGATMTRCSALPSARNRGSGFCIRRSRRCGRRATDEDGITFAAGSTRLTANLRSSACGPAKSMPSPSRTASSATGPIRDTAYAMRRRDAFIVAVNCGEAGGTCFCVSMQTGPKADSGFDLALTELLDDAATISWSRSAAKPAPNCLRRCRIVRPRSRSSRPPRRSSRAPASRDGTRAGDRRASRNSCRAISNHPRWDDVAERCLTCGNCTMVCPTCFCTTVEDHSDLTGTSAERVRKWDSCFTMDFSYIHGGSVRKTGPARATGNG